MTALQVHRNSGFIKFSIWAWIGIKQMGGVEYCWPENRWAFLKSEVLIRFVIGDFVVNVWKPWVVLSRGFCEPYNRLRRALRLKGLSV